jgi:RHS repeat-associated protein
MIKQTAIALQESHYYPFGKLFDQPAPNTTGNLYFYNGKELQPDFGLDWYDYGARMYDANVGRFWSVDPLAMKYAYKTPFDYAENSPISFIDLDGQQKMFYVHDKNYINQINNAKSPMHAYGIALEAVKNGKAYTRGNLNDKGGVHWGIQAVNSVGTYPLVDNTSDKNWGKGKLASDEITKKDWTVGLGVIGIMTGVGSIIEAGSVSFIAGVGLANNLDDAFSALTDGDGSALENLAPENIQEYIGILKMGLSTLTAGDGTKSLLEAGKKGKESDLALTGLGILLDYFSVLQKSYEMAQKRSDEAKKQEQKNENEKSNAK